MNRRNFIKTGLIYVPTLFVCNEGIARLGNLEPEVHLWKIRVVNQGGGYTGKSIVCNDTMMKLWKANGLRTGIIRANTCTGVGIKAINIALIADTNAGTSDETNPFGTPMVDADFVEGTGLTGNGTTKMITTGCKQSDLYNIDGTNHGFSHAVYVCASTNQNGFAMGTYDGSDFVYLYVSNGGGHSFYSGGATANQIDVVDSAGTGFYCGNRVSGTSMKLYKRGVEIGTTGSPGAAQNSGFWVGFLDVNNQNSNVVAPSTKTFGGYQLGRSFNAAEQIVLDYIWTRGMRILGRSVT